MRADQDVDRLSGPVLHPSSAMVKLQPKKSKAQQQGQKLKNCGSSTKHGTMRLPSDDSSLEDDASVSDTLPAHMSDEEQVGLVAAADGTKRSPRRTTSSFSLALQTQAITVPSDPWEAIRTKQRRIRR